MNSTRTLLAALGTAGLAMTAIAPSASAATSTAASPVCEVRTVSVKALDLRDDNQPTDEIFVRLDGTPTTTQTYVLGQSRNTLGTGSKIFSGTALVKLVEVGPGNLVISTINVGCQDRVRTLTMSNGDAAYEVRLQVTEL